MNSFPNPIEILIVLGTEFVSPQNISFTVPVSIAVVIIMSLLSAMLHGVSSR